MEPLELALWACIFLYLLWKRRKEVLYIAFLSLFFSVVLNYVGEKPLLNPWALLSSAIGVFYPVLFLLSLFYLLQSFSLSTASSIILGAGIGALGRRSEKELDREYGEVKRKIFHMLSGFALFAVPYFFGRKWGILFVMLSAFLAFLIPKLEIPFLETTIREMYEVRGERPAEGAFNFALGAVIPVLIDQPWIVLALGIGDGVSALVGKFFGRTRIYRKKSLEGTLAEFLAVLTVAKYFYPSPLIPALIYTSVELLSPIDDNLVIPLALSLLYWPWF